MQINVPFQKTSEDVWSDKHRLKDSNGENIDKTVNDTFKRIADALANVEDTPEKRQEWSKKFYDAQVKGGLYGGGRIMANAGASKYKPNTSLINCTVSRTINDSMEGILDTLKDAGLTLQAGCGIGYELSSLRPKNAKVGGVGAFSSGPLSFAEIFDKMCGTISSAGGRRGKSVC